MTAPSSTIGIPSSPASSAIGEITRDGAIGTMLDGIGAGLILSIALVAGLSAASVSREIVGSAGLAAVIAAGVAIGLAAHLAARSGARRLDERAHAARTMAARSAAEPHEVMSLLARYGIVAREGAPIVMAFARRPAAWREFAAHFERSRPDAMGSLKHATAVTALCVAGGALPLVPYTLGMSVTAAPSIGIALSALLAVGYVRARALGSPALTGAARAALVGAVAAGAAFIVARTTA